MDHFRLVVKTKLDEKYFLDNESTGFNKNVIDNAQKLYVILSKLVGRQTKKANYFY